MSGSLSCLESGCRVFGVIADLHGLVGFNSDLSSSLYEMYELDWVGRACLFSHSFCLVLNLGGNLPASSTLEIGYSKFSKRGR